MLNVYPIELENSYFETLWFLCSYCRQHIVWMSVEFEIEVNSVLRLIFIVLQCLSMIFECHKLILRLSVDKEYVLMTAY